jgi:hypothetical protein
MSRVAVVLMGITFACDVSAAAADEGHPKIVVITGTLFALDSNRIQIETRDNVSFALTRVWVITTRNTRYKRGRVRIETGLIRLVPGEQITAVATREHVEDYSLRLVALDIALSGARRSHVQVTTLTGEVLSIVITDRRPILDFSKTRDSK